MITVMTGDSLSSDRSNIADPKHFAVHKYPHARRNSSPKIDGELTTPEDFLPAYDKAYNESGALTAMCAYSK